MPKIRLATHAGDIDGLACAALFYRKFGERRVSVDFLSVIEAQETCETYDYATDLPKPKNARRVIDHHPLNLERLKRERRFDAHLDIIDHKSPSAAYLVYHHLNLPLTDAISRKIVALANDADHGKLPSQHAPLFHLTRWFIDDNENLNRLAKILADRGVDNAIEHPWIRNEYKTVRRRVSRTNRKIYRFLNRNKEKIGDVVFIDTRKFLPAKFAKQIIGPFFRAGARVVIIAYEDIRNNLITTSIRVASSFKKSLNVGDLASKFGGGGHEKAAAVRAASDEELAQILEEFTRFAKKEGLSFRNLTDESK